MPGGLNFDFTFQGGDKSRRTDQEQPMRILVVGDFSGRGSRGEGVPGIAERPVLSIDIDNFDAILMRMAPKIRVELGDAAFTIDIEDLDDFHPDALYDKLDLFQELRRTRKRLMDPATFDEAAAELRTEADSTPEEADAPTEAPKEDDSGTLERLLGQSATPTTESVRTTAGQVNVADFIRNIVAKHIVPGPDPRQDQYVSSVDAAITDQMRELLAAPGFRAVEAAWLSLRGIVTGVETTEDLKISVFDMTKAELFEDLRAAQPDVTASSFYRRVVERETGGPGGEPWSMIVTDMSFAPVPEDIGMLAALGVIGARAGGPVLAGATAGFVGLDTWAGHADSTAWPGMPGEMAGPWQELRKSAVAPWIGLATPRVLARLPYGSDTDEIDRFTFEEISGSSDHEALVWANPAFTVARLIAAAFTQRGWRMEPGDLQDLDDLPHVIRRVDGESRLTPCAEENLSERAGETILKAGLIPVLSWKNRNAVHVVRFHSIADPAGGLEGPWR
jgi:type VI secretion system protein ImpC